MHNIILFLLHGSFMMWVPQCGILGFFSLQQNNLFDKHKTGLSSFGYFKLFNNE